MGEGAHFLPSISSSVWVRSLQAIETGAVESRSAGDWPKRWKEIRRHEIAGGTLLRIFVSSVSREFDAEREVLKAEIQALGGIFSGMEIFGSDPQRPADYCAQVSAKAHLYVGVFGSEYGSIDPASGLSFTRVEYEAALRAQVPQLIYMPQRLRGDTSSDSVFDRFKASLRQRHTVGWFTDAEDLRVQFLRDFVRLLPEQFLGSVIPLGNTGVPADALHSVLRGMLPREIERVAQGKYAPALYVSRNAEAPLADFVGQEPAYLRTVHLASGVLAEIDAEYGLRAGERLSAACITLSTTCDTESARAAIEELKAAFLVPRITSLRQALDRLIEDTAPFRPHASIRQWFDQVRAFGGSGASSTGEGAAQLEELRRQHASGAQYQANTMYGSLLRLLPSVRRDGITLLASDVVQHLAEAAERYLRRCAVVVAQAGAGKTNLLCALAQRISRDHPVMLVAGQAALAHPSGVEGYVQTLLEREFRGLFPDWANRMSEGLRKAGKWLVLVIDGINECDDPHTGSRHLREFLSTAAERRIRVILSCRDLMWQGFAAAVEGHLAPGMVRLHEFHEAQWTDAVARYLEHYEIQAVITGNARATLRNPLLLRLFCETHRGESLGRVEESRTVSVLDGYLTTVGRTIADRLRLAGSRAVEELLIQVAERFWAARASDLPVSALRLTPEEQSLLNSVYARLLDENVLREDRLESGEVRVRFVYDEMFEYMIARAWRASGASPNAVVAATIDEFDRYTPVFGAFLLFDTLSGARGAFVNQFLKAAHAVPNAFSPTRQVRLMYAVEAMNPDEVDAGLVQFASDFEREAIPDVRHRVAPAILRVAKAAPRDPASRALVERMLEIERPAPAVGVKTSDNISRVLEKGGSPVGRRGTNDHPTLPPARFHHSEATRLNALSVLVSSVSPNDPEGITHAIALLGRTDIHSAIEAMKSLDQASDRVVLPLVTSYGTSQIAEYQLYSVYLLRNRFGPVSAEVMVGLITSSHARVRRYAMKVLETRRIEPELLCKVLTQLEDDGVPPWNQRNLLRLLDRPDQVSPATAVEIYRPQIVEMLRRSFDHPLGSVRLEAYRSALPHLGHMDAAAYHARLRADPDVDVRRFARRLAARNEPTPGEGWHSAPRS